MLPGSTERFQKQFPKLHLLFNPEFLVAKTAVRDFAKPDRQIVGYTKKSKPYAELVLRVLPKAPYMRLMPATEAEMAKYFGNAFLATKVMFANQMYDICAKLGLDYDLVMEGASSDPRIGKSHLQIFRDGYRGYGGACLPKDMKALIDFAKKIGVPIEMLATTDRLNDSLRGHDEASG
jgi:UDPglucose 6-dehydrogenase